MIVIKACNLMGLLEPHASILDDWHPSPGGSAVDDPAINPATGLPMTGGIDVAGNPFGTDLFSYRHDHCHHDSQCSGSSFDDHRTGWYNPFLTDMGGMHDPWRD